MITRTETIETLSFNAHVEAMEDAGWAVRQIVPRVVDYDSTTKTQYVAAVIAGSSVAEMIVVFEREK